jgi:NAD(P)-dependent dehydrogenase (short-subunit alcohol dehydrogenase family)
VVTGAAGDMGGAVCKRLLDDGYEVMALVRRSSDAVDERAKKHAADLGQESEVEAAYEAARSAFGAVWGSVHCAGGWAGGTVSATTVETYDRMMSMNLRSAFLCCRAAMRRMSGQGRIVNVSAYTAAALHGISGSAAYAASKAGIIALTKAIAEEAQADLRANCIAPGTLLTSKNAAGMPKSDSSGWIPLTQIADSIAYLLSPDAPNGAVLTFPSR